MAASNTRFTQNSLGQSKTPIDSDHGIYRDRREFMGLLGGAAATWPYLRSPLLLTPTRSTPCLSR